MNGSDPDERLQPGTAGAVNFYCLATLVANEASQSGYLDFARELETLLTGFLSGLPREEQDQALRRSYEMALCGEDPAPSPLRLVYSRD